MGMNHRGDTRHESSEKGTSNLHADFNAENSVANSSTADVHILVQREHLSIHCAVFLYAAPLASDRHKMVNSTVHKRSRK